MSRPRPLGSLALACALVPLLFAASADAKLIKYAGETEQGYGVTLKTNAKGRAQYMSVSADTECRHPAVRRIRQSFEPRFRKTDYGGFVDGGHVSHHFKKYDTVGKVRAKVRGTRIDRDRIRGTFRWQIKYFDHGKQFNSCRTGTIRWSVHR